MNRKMVKRLEIAVERLGGDLAFRWAETVGYEASGHFAPGKPPVYRMKRI